MTIREYRAKFKSKISLTGLRTMIRLSVIQEPLTQDNLIFLTAMEKVWGKNELIRNQISKKTAAARENLAFTAHLPDNWARYAQTRIFNLRLMHQRISKKELIMEMEDRYPSFSRLFAYDPIFVHKEITRLRQRAAYYVRRYRERQKTKGAKKCPECGRDFRHTDGKDLYRMN